MYIIKLSISYPKKKKYSVFNCVEDGTVNYHWLQGPTTWEKIITTAENHWFTRLYYTKQYTVFGYKYIKNKYINEHNDPAVKLSQQTFKKAKSSFVY